MHEGDIRCLLGKLRHTNCDQRCSVTSAFDNRYLGGIEIISVERAFLGSSKDAHHAFQRGGSSQLWEQILNEPSSGVVHESCRKSKTIRCL